jgi:hypothetical protein
MFADYVFEKSSAAYSNKILLIDAENLLSATDCCTLFSAHGFQVIHFNDDLTFRIQHDDVIQGKDIKCVLLAKSSDYIPYDIHKRFRCFEVSFSNLFPLLNSSALKDEGNINLDLLSMAYQRNYTDLKIYPLTQQFLRNKVYSRENMSAYLQECKKKLDAAVIAVKTYQDWFHIAELKSAMDVISVKYDIPIQSAQVQEAFKEFVLAGFGKLSASIDKDGPVLVSRAMEYMHGHSDKFAIIVMDGMSEFDWHILAESFKSIRYEKANAFAMIPTTTSISRQCLLSNKYPVQLQEPWKQSKEKYEFYDCAQKLGFVEAQIGYERGYEADFAASVKCAAVIINDVDDMVHGQKQGRIGMLNDVTVLSKQGQLLGLTKRLLHHGFDVYISADHGNTPCTGMGKLMKTGVEVETKSRRMIVLRDFADKQSLARQYELIDYPKYYLSKEFDYLICEAGRSFDAKGEEVMSHGGITVDEVIVPFIKIKADENNG